MSLQVRNVEAVGPLRASETNTLRRRPQEIEGRATPPATTSGGCSRGEQARIAAFTAEHRQPSHVSGVANVCLVMHARISGLRSAS